MDFCIQREATKKPYGVKGGIVCDEMGLGKTILMLGCIAVNPTGVSGADQNLIVVPPALLTQWSKIVKKFMGFSPIIYHGYGTKNITDEELAASPIVLTTYGMISERGRLRSSPVENKMVATNHGRGTSHPQHENGRF